MPGEMSIPPMILDLLTSLPSYYLGNWNNNDRLDFTLRSWIPSWPEDLERALKFLSGNGITEFRYSIMNPLSSPVPKPPSVRSLSYSFKFVTTEYA